MWACACRTIVNVRSLLPSCKHPQRLVRTFGTVPAYSLGMLDSSIAYRSNERRHTRYRLARWVEMTVGDEEFHCFADDISFSGARLQTVILATGERVSLHMLLPQVDGGSCLVALTAVVVWADGTQAGVRFLRVPDDFEGICAAAMQLGEPV